MKCHEGFTAVRVDLESQAELDLILDALEQSAELYRGPNNEKIDLDRADALDRARVAIAEAAGL